MTDPKEADPPDAPMTPDREPNFRRKVLSSFAWMGSAQFFGQLASWAATILVIRLLEPGDYGVMAMATVFLSFLFMLSDLGIGAAIVQAKEISAEDARSIQGFIILFNLAGFAIVLAGSGLIAAFFNEPLLIPILRTLSTCFILMALYVYPQAMLQRELKYDRKAKVDFVSMSAAALVPLGCAVLGLGVWSLVAGTLATHALRAIGFNLAHRGTPWPSWSLSRVSGFLGFGGIIVVERILWFLYTNLDVMIAGRLLEKELVGFYAVALSLSAIPLAKVMPIINQVSFSAFSRIQQDLPRVRDNVLRAIRFGFAIFLPVLWGMALVAPDGIPLLLGEDWRHLVLPIQLISAVLPLKAIAALLPPALFGIGRPAVSAVNMGITASIMAVAFYLGAQSGLTGLAMAWPIAFPFAFAIIAFRSLPVLGVGFGAFWGSVRASLFSGVVMAGTVIAVQAGLADSEPLLRLLASVASGALAYAAMMRLLDRTAIPELRRLLAR